MGKSKKKRKKIIVALSGGVDSAMAAALLKKQGHDVVGVYFRFFGSTWKPNFQVKKIAKKLGIPLKIFDARKEFKKRVIDYFLNAYKKGTTPNPCVVCNKEIKFRLLFDLMRKLDADYVATGHYARVTKQSSAFSCLGLSSGHSSKPSFFYVLYEAKDKTKDQSYFLYRLAQKDLAKIIFPLGDYKKSEIKKLAKKLKLPTLKNESQDVCFLDGKSVADFLRKNLQLKEGKIVDEKRKILGKHKGLPLYTLGQRKGIEIGGKGPYFVVRKNLLSNELVVTNNPKKLLTKIFFVSGANWISGQPKFPLRAKVQTRYRAERFSATIRKVGSGKWEVRSEKPLRAVTPGQAAVFYKNREVLGGGTIL